MLATLDHFLRRRGGRGSWFTEPEAYVCVCQSVLSLLALLVIIACHWSRISSFPCCDPPRVRVFRVVWFFVWDFLSLYNYHRTQALFLVFLRHSLISLDACRYTMCGIRRGIVRPRSILQTVSFFLHFFPHSSFASLSVSSVLTRGFFTDSHSYMYVYSSCIVPSESGRPSGVARQLACERRRGNRTSDFQFPIAGRNVLRVSRRDCFRSLSQLYEFMSFCRDCESFAAVFVPDDACCILSLRH